MESFGKSLFLTFNSTEFQTERNVLQVDCLYHLSETFALTPEELHKIKRRQLLKKR